jgi:hypothetical protein
MDVGFSSSALGSPSGIGSLNRFSTRPTLFPLQSLALRLGGLPVGGASDSMRHLVVVAVGEVAFFADVRLLLGS